MSSSQSRENFSSGLSKLLKFSKIIEEKNRSYYLIIYCQKILFLKFGFSKVICCLFAFSKNIIETKIEY